jgi:cytochrome c biogenesis protein CcmG/thiol:disulfide interchange protein DsbE
VPVTVVLLGAALVALLAFGLADKSGNQSLDNAVNVGKWPVAPVKSLPLLVGAGQRSLASYRGEVVVLNFWASWCPPCHQEAPLLESAQRVLLEHHATVLGVTYEDAAPDSQSFVHRYSLTFPELRDGDGSYAHLFGTDQLPESFVINRSGRVQAISRGEINRAWLNRAIALAERS